MLLNIKRHKAKFKQENKNRPSPVADMLPSWMVSRRDIPCSLIQLQKQIHQCNKHLLSLSPIQVLCYASVIKIQTNKKSIKKRHDLLQKFWQSCRGTRHILNVEFNVMRVCSLQNEQQTTSQVSVRWRSEHSAMGTQIWEKTSPLPELVRKHFVKEKHVHVTVTEASTVICWEAKGWEWGGHSRQRDHMSRSIRAGQG